MRFESCPPGRVRPCLVWDLIFGIATHRTVANTPGSEEFFPNQNPIGHRLQQTFAGAPATEIVGVVGDAKYADLRDRAPATFYIHDLQRPAGAKTFAVRTAGDAAAIIPAVREMMRTIDPLVPLRMVSTQSDSIERSISPERVFALTTSLFSALALVISMIGLFGLMSYSVARRTKEIGIRMAVGAHPRDVLWSILRETMTLVALGILTGLAAAVGSVRFIAARLYGLAPYDLPAVGGAIGIMLVVAIVAAYIPARRASMVDPLTALHHD